jgi:phospholipase C
MRPDNRSKTLRHRLLAYVALGAMAVNVLAPIAAAEAQTSSPLKNRALPTSTPIKHLIVVIGENRSFDNVFATFVSPDPKQSVWNLLSQGIVYKTGAPGPNVKKASQQRAIDHDTYRLAPQQVKGGEFSLCRSRAPRSMRSRKTLAT